MTRLVAMVLLQLVIVLHVLWTIIYITKTPRAGIEPV
jgi:hypothetical protein